MKKFFKALFAILIMFVLFGCSKPTEEPTKQSEKTKENTPTPVEVEYTVTYVTNCDQKLDPIKVKDVSEIVLPTLEKTGYSFKGWYLEEACENKFSLVSFKLEADLTLYAKFEAESYIVNFLVDGKIVDGQFVDYGQAAVEPAAPTKPGYTFKGWDKDFSNITEDTSINALFEINSYTVKFMDGDTLLKEESVKYGQAATAPEAPEKTGYVFKNWDKDFSAITEDLIIKAKYVVQTFEVKFRLSETDETFFDIQEVDYGQSADDPAIPSKVGYIFKGWDKSYAEITEDTIITAIFEIRTFTIDYVVDGIVYKSVTVEYGKDAEVPADPTKEGYEFKGWDKECKNVTYDNTVTAIFEAKSFSIKYYNGTSELTLTPNSYKAGEAVDLPEFNEEGYIFAGWYTSSDFKGAGYAQTDDTLTSDVIFYALNVKVEIGTNATSWTFSGFDTTNTVGKGIDAVSNLPEQYEKDFFKYLSDNNLLNSDKLHSTTKAATWEKFSGLNPIHNGDPKRIWNDTSSNTSGAGDGYSSLFLYDEITLDSSNNLVDIKGGFLGTEPYKTKYFNLMYQLTQIVAVKYSNTLPTNKDTNSTRGLYAFVIDGFFYGTQSVKDNPTTDADKLFKALRSVVPTTTTTYKYEGGQAVAMNNTYTNTTDFSNINVALAIPCCDGKVFFGWYLDEALTKPALGNLTQHCTLYPRFD